MEYLIYSKENEDTFIETVNSAYEYTTTEFEDNALLFASETAALDMVGHLEGTTDFWGTRPPRPK